jgi:hypothetical protein
LRQSDRGARDTHADIQVPGSGLAEAIAETLEHRDDLTYDHERM